MLQHECLERKYIMQNAKTLISRIVLSTDKTLNFEILYIRVCAQNVKTNEYLNTMVDKCMVTITKERVFDTYSRPSITGMISMMVAFLLISW